MNILTKVTLTLALATSLFGQQPPKGSTDQPPKKDSVESAEPAMTENFYKLAFTVYELEDGKRTNQRNYMMMGKPNWHASSLRIGTRVPVNTEDKKMQYVDAGLDIRCDLKEQKGAKLQADCDIGISSIIPTDQVANSGTGGPSAPVMRNTRTSSSSLLTLGKSAVITTVDDVNSTKRMQVELTATKVD
jgi:hypothetical protein